MHIDGAAHCFPNYLSKFQKVWKNQSFSRQKQAFLWHKGCLQRRQDRQYAEKICDKSGRPHGMSGRFRYNPAQREMLPLR